MSEHRGRELTPSRERADSGREFARCSYRVCIWHVRMIIGRAWVTATGGAGSFISPEFDFCSVGFPKRHAEQPQCRFSRSL
jgi:hypothetical protein